MNEQKQPTPSESGAAATRRLVTIYTDGACSGNPGRGGWGAILSDGEKTKEIYGGEGPTTNSRMEMMAPIKALALLKTPCDVIIRSDSQFLVRGASEWMPGWKAKGWRKANGKPVENEDLWLEIDRLMAFHDITWEWVRGHNGDPMNEKADHLANLGVKMKH